MEDKELEETETKMVQVYDSMVDEAQYADIQEKLIQDIFKNAGIPVTVSYVNAIIQGYKMAETIRMLNSSKVGFGAATLLALRRDLLAKKAAMKMPEELKDL